MAKAQLSADVDLPRLRQQLEASRDFVFSAVKIPQNVFGASRDFVFNAAKIPQDLFGAQ